MRGECGQAVLFHLQGGESQDATAPSRAGNWQEVMFDKQFGTLKRVCLLWRERVRQSQQFQIGKARDQRMIHHHYHHHMRCIDGSLRVAVENRAARKSVDPSKRYKL
jgi:hypothetical protein